MITVQINGNGNTLDGYRYFWCKYVRGFKPDVHCAKCLVGPYSKVIRKGMAIGVPVTLNERTDFDYIYICGVSPKWSTNFHLALSVSPDAVVTEQMYNGRELVVTNARAIDIPALPDGFGGLNKRFTTCRNFQFGVKTYGFTGE